MHCFSTFVPQIGYLSTFPRSGVAQAAFVARGLLKQPEYLSSLGGCRSSFRRSGLPEKNPRAAFVARGLPEQLFSLLGLLEQPSSLGDCPNTFRRSGIARAAFVAPGWPEQFLRWIFLVAIGLSYSTRIHIYCYSSNGFNLGQKMQPLSRLSIP
jgi:hypothetical protein